MNLSYWLECIPTYWGWNSDSTLHKLLKLQFCPSIKKVQKLKFEKKEATVGVSFIDVDVDLRNLNHLLGLENHVNYIVVEVLSGYCRLNQALIWDKWWSNYELICISKPLSKLPIGFGNKALIWLVDVFKT